MPSVSRLKFNSSSIFSSVAGMAMMAGWAPDIFVGFSRSPNLETFYEKLAHGELSHYPINEILAHPSFPGHSK